VALEEVATREGTETEAVVWMQRAAMDLEALKSRSTLQMQRGSPLLAAQRSAIGAEAQSRGTERLARWVRNQTCRGMEGRRGQERFVEMVGRRGIEAHSWEEWRS